MNLATVISCYLMLNITVAAAYVTLRGAAWLRGEWLTFSQLRHLHAVAMSFVLAAPLIATMLPRQNVFRPAMRIWAASSSTELRKPQADHAVLVAPVASSQLAMKTSNATLLLAGLALLMTLVAVVILVRDLKILTKLRRTSHTVRRIGRTQISVSSSIDVPFSYRSPRIAHVVLPEYLAAKPVDYRIAVQHELQHHRQGDTRIVYAFWFLRLTCFANPFVHLWARELSELQEFACDETLVDHGKVESHAYASCLFEVAKTASRLNANPVCATGLTFQTKGTLLKRRITTMINASPSTNRSSKRSRLYASAIGLSAILVLSAFTTTGLVQDRRVTRETADSYIAKARGNSDIPLVLNDRVLHQLNIYIGTPEGREFMRNALVRMKSESAAIEAEMIRYGVPKALLAMPIIESGYQNLPQDKTAPMKGAGLWQFIPETARAYGLRVDTVVDERLNKPKLTDAAMRLLLANKLRFGDWLLSVSAYNAGEGRVQEGIDKTGSRDAWTLVGKGFEGDHDYLAKLTAAIMIMNNPESVQ